MIGRDMEVHTGALATYNPRRSTWSEQLPRAQMLRRMLHSSEKRFWHQCTHIHVSVL